MHILLLAQDKMKQFKDMMQKIKDVNGALYKVEATIEIGASPNSIMKSEKSLLANALGGWAVRGKVQYGEQMSDLVK